MSNLPHFTREVIQTLVTIGFAFGIGLVLIALWQAGEIIVLALQRHRSGLIAGTSIPREDLPPTAREIAVFLTVARGASHKIAAEELGLSPRTVGRHLQSLYRKKRVGNLAGAIVACLRDGEITEEDILQPAANGAQKGCDDIPGDPATGGADQPPHETRAGCMPGEAQ